MKDLITKMLAKLGELKQQANDALAKLKPMEQQEAAQEMAWVFRAGRNCLENLNEISAMAEGKLQEYAEQMKEAAKIEVRADEAFRQEIAKDPKVLESVKAQLLQSGELVTKTDMDGKIQAAETARETSVRTAIQAEVAEKEKITTRRGEAAAEIAAKLKAKLGDKAPAVAAEVAGKLKDDDLKGDDYRDKFAAPVGRVEKCAALGIIKTETLQEVATMADATFTNLHAGWEEQARASRGGGNPLGTPARPGRAGDQKKVLVC
jgi:hypothetical protein